MNTSFYDFLNIPDLNSVSKEFWKMTTVVNWKKVLETNRKINTIWVAQYSKQVSNAIEMAEKRLCLNYTFEEIKKFRIEYDIIYCKLYDYFEDISKKEKLVSDDVYSDLLSSIIGSGKFFTKKCINNVKYFIEMAENDDFVENFGYLFLMNEKEYIKIREQYDPIFRDTRKYNL